MNDSGIGEESARRLRARQEQGGGRSGWRTSKGLAHPPRLDAALLQVVDGDQVHRQGTVLAQQSEHGVDGIAAVGTVELVGTDQPALRRQSHAQVAVVPHRRGQRLARAQRRLRARQLHRPQAHADRSRAPGQGLGQHLHRQGIVRRHFDLERTHRVEGQSQPTIGQRFETHVLVARDLSPRRTLPRAATHQETGNPLRLLWLLAVGSDPEGQYEQFRSTFYGLTNVTGPDSQSLTPCYFLKHAAFFRWRETLDGAVIATPRGAELLLNPFSTRYAEIRDSEIARMFGPHVVDPVSLEHKGHAYIADCDIDRSQEGEVIAYIARKYNRPLLMTFNLGSLVAYIDPPDEQL